MLTGDRHTIYVSNSDTNRSFDQARPGMYGDRPVAGLNIFQSFSYESQGVLIQLRVVLLVQQEPTQITEQPNRRVYQQTPVGSLLEE